MTTDLSFNFTPEDIYSCFEPAIRQEVSHDDAQWIQAIEKQQKKNAKKTKSGLLSKIFTRPKKRRSSKDVKNIYEQNWNPEMALSRLDLSEGKAGPVVWGDRKFFANTIGTKRVHLMYLMETIKQLKPRRVLEIGSGTGHNLFILAAHNPDVEFNGVELSEAGTKAAEKISQLETLPDLFETFAPFPLESKTAHQSVKVINGSAQNIPFEDNSFDLVYSMLALEQMESIRQDVLDEVSRVCRGHTFMAEPFADANQSPVRKSKIDANNYFAANVADLENHGLTPIFSTQDIPAKYQMGVCIAIAQKT